MTILAGVSKVVISGTLQGGEEFATGFWLDGVPAQSQADATAQAVTLRSYFEQNWLTVLKSFLTPGSSYDRVTVYSYPNGGPTSSYLGESAITAGAGTATANELPQQCALVITTQTGFPGRRRRGRMYLPITAAILEDHQMNLGVITSIVQGGVSFVNDIQGNAILGDPVVLSQVGAGSTAPWTALRADSRLDVQRRRAAHETVLAEYSAAV